MIRTCENCGNSFKARPFDVRRGYGKYCNKECSYSAKEKPSGKENAWRWYNSTTKRWYRRWKNRGDRKIYSLPEHRWVWEISKGIIPQGYEVHHIDGDRHNNDKDNLTLLSKEEHQELHRRETHQHKLILGRIHRKCQSCGKYKPLQKFHKRGKHSWQGYCRECANEYRTNWRKQSNEQKRRIVTFGR